MAPIVSLGGMSTPEPQHGINFLTFPAHAIEEAGRRVPDLDPMAMEFVLMLHRVTSAVTYDLESSVHRPAGWSWSGFRLLFMLWIAGPVDGPTAMALSGMSRAAVSNLVNTLQRDGLVHRGPNPKDARGVLLSLTAEGMQAFTEAFRSHNQRESAWAAALEPEEREMLTALLGKLAAAAQEGWVRRRE